MASGIATATAKAPPPSVAQAPDITVENQGQDQEQARGRRRFSPLTRRILAVNILALGVLGIGLLQLGDYQRSLVEAQITALKTQAEVFGAALGEGAVRSRRGRAIPRR